MGVCESSEQHSVLVQHLCFVARIFVVHFEFQSFLQRHRKMTGQCSKIKSGRSAVELKSQVSEREIVIPSQTKKVPLLHHNQVVMWNYTLGESSGKSLVEIYVINEIKSFLEI